MASSIIIAVVWLVAVNLTAYLLNENSILKPAWARARTTTLFSSNRASAVSSQTRPVTYWTWDLHDATDLVVCWFVRGRPGVALLLVYRLLACGFFVATMLLIEFDGAGLTAGDFLPYFTNWTLVLLAATFLLGSVLCVRYLARLSTKDGVAGRGSFDLLSKAYALLAITTTASGVFLTLFYWLVLYDAKEKHYADNALRHGVNVVVLWVDFALSRTPVCSYWFQPVLAYATIYAIFMVIYHAASGVWTYAALNWWHSTAGAYYIVIPFLAYLGFILTYCVAGLREFLYRRRCCCMCCPSCCCVLCCGWAACREEDLLEPYNSAFVNQAHSRWGEPVAPTQQPPQ